MLTDEDQVSELKRAYHVLGVSHSSPAPAIKHNYHTLVKRWHPDRCLGGSRAEATQMMKVLNDAYSKIKDAVITLKAIRGSLHKEGTILCNPRKQKEFSQSETDLIASSSGCVSLADPCWAHF